VGLPAEVEPSFEAAFQRARALAAVQPGSSVLVAGSHYAIAPARHLVDGLEIPIYGGK
jgi:hypothetical protein